MTIPIRQTAVLCALFLFLGIAGAAGGAPAPDKNAQLRKRLRDLDTQLLEERTRILRTDADAVRIRQQIAALYRQLEKLLDSKPSIRKLQLERDAVSRDLNDRHAAPKPGPHPGNRPK